MTYSSLAQLTDRTGLNMMIMLTDRGDVPLGVVDTTVVDRALAEADAMIDGYLAVRYVLPLASTPSLLADLATSIALWKLHVTQPEDKVVRDYNDALKALRDISVGTLRLPDVAGLEPASSGAGGVQINDRERPFTESNMKGFI